MRVPPSQNRPEKTHEGQKTEGGRFTKMMTRHVVFRFNFAERRGKGAYRVALLPLFHSL
jgi:hypothetical protein